MTAYSLWTVFTWTFKGILCTCRFLWICPYNAIKFLPRKRQITEDTRRQLKQLVGSESKAIAAIPGSPDRATSLDKRLTKTEKEILSLKTKVACDKVSCERSVRSWRTSTGPHRAFVPHSPMDLELGHRVRIMLPSGRISTGTIRFLGHLQGEADLHLGVELQTPDHGLHDGSHRGLSYFECKPGYGAFVPFHKLLVAWDCGSVRNGPKRGRYKMLGLGAAPERDLTSIFADLAVHCNGDGWGGCFGVAHQAGTCEEGSRNLGFLSQFISQGQ
ncbi:hypothetical protein FQN60_017130, partial [Etheostoma spectabile]